MKYCIVETAVKLTKYLKLHCIANRYTKKYLHYQ